MHLLGIFFVLLLALTVRGQTLKCNSIAGGCDQGKANEAALRGAIARFDTSKGYGDQDNIFSTFLSGGALAQISYTCQDGSSSPVIDGSQAQSLLGQILSCEDQCGSVTLSGNEKCGFGVLVATNASAQDCFSKAINVVPQSTDKPTPPPPPPGSTTTTATPTPPAPSSVVVDDANDVDNKVKDAQSKSKSFSDNPNDNTKSDLQKAIDDATNSAKKAQIDAKTDSSKWSEFLDHIDDVLKNLDDAAATLTGPPSAETAAAIAASIAAAATAATAATAAKSSTNPPENSTPPASQPPATTPPVTSKPPSASSSPTSTSSSSSSSSQTCDLCVACADSTLPPDPSSDATDVPDSDPPAATETGLAARGIVKRANARKEVGPFCGNTPRNSYYSRPYAQGSSGRLFPYYGYTYRSSTTTCTWNPVFISEPAQPNPLPEPRTQAGTYATEHVYEAQLVAQFINSFDQSCSQAGLLKTYLIRENNWPGLQGAAAQPFRKSNSVGRPGTSSAAALDELMDNLSANPETALPDRNDELFYLDEDLNSLKAAVFNGNTQDYSSSNVANGKLAKVTRMCMLYSYLQAVKPTYLKVSRRMYATMQKLDQTIASSTIQPPNDAAGNAISFAQKYKSWEDNFLFSAGSKVELSMDSILKSAKNQISTDDKLGSKTIRDKFLTTVNGLTDPGTLCYPDKWLDLDDLLSLDKNP